MCSNVHFTSRRQIITSMGDGPVRLQMGGGGVDLLSGCQHDGTMDADPVMHICPIVNTTTGRE